MSQLAKALRGAWVYDGGWSEHRQRPHGRPAIGVDGSRFVVCTQNHDPGRQPGAGRAAGRTASWPACGSPRRCSSPRPSCPSCSRGRSGAPARRSVLPADHRDAELGRTVSEGRRHEFATFGWDPDAVPDPQAEATFVRSRLDWDELGVDEHAALLDWYRALLTLRREWPDLTDPRLDRVEVRFDETARWLVLGRGSLVVALNLGRGNGGRRCWRGADPRRRARHGLPTDSVVIARRSLPSRHDGGQDALGG